MLRAADADAQTLPAWAAVYLRYVRLLKELDEAHDQARPSRATLSAPVNPPTNARALLSKQLAQPQKRALCRAALEACAVRVRELRAWLRVSAGGEPGKAAIAEALAALRLSPDTALLAPPRAFARQQELEARCAELRAAVAARPASAHQAPQAGLASDDDGADPDEKFDETEPDDADEEAEAAVAPEGDDLAEPRLPPSEEEAAVRLQAGARGLLARRAAAAERAEEDALLGLSLKARAGGPTCSDLPGDVAARAAAIAAARRALAADFASEFAAAREPAADALAAREAAALKERYREALLAWVMARRDPATGAYPELPTEAQGGVAAALAPPPPPAEPEAKGGAKGGKGAPAAKPAAAGKPAKGGPPPGPTPPARSAAFGAMEAAVASFACDWEGRNDAGTDNPGQRFDLGVLESALRPAMEATVAAAAAEEVTALVGTMRAAAATARAAAGTDGSKGGSKGGAKDAEKAGNATKKAAPAAGGATAKKAAGAKGAKGPKDPTADVPIEELQAELASIGVLRLDAPSNAPRWGDIVAPVPLVAAPPAGASAAAPVDPTAKAPAKGGKGAPAAAAAAPPVAPPPPSGGAALFLEALTEHLVLPLGCAPPAEDAKATPPPPPRALLLSSAPGGGKKLMAAAAVAAAGAATLDLSPLLTDALGPAYAGKAPGTLLVHKAFKVAKAMAPAVIIVHEAERLLTADKRYISGGAEPYNRLKRDILKEAAALAPRDRVTLLLLTSDVVAVAGKDPAAVGTSLDVILHLPPPDDAARRRLWPAMARAAGVADVAQPDLAAVAKLSEGITPGGMLAAINAAPKPLTAAALLDAVAAAGPRPGLEAAEAPRREAVAALQAAAASAAAGGAPAPKAKGK